MAWNRRVRESCLRSLVSSVVVLAFCVGGITPTRAGEAAKDAKQEAKARFSAGQSHYNLNEFADAFREFKDGYRLFPDPVFLYNLGQCERQLGHAEEAIKFYRSFLREQPKAPNRQEVQNKIAELEAALKNKSAEPATLEPGKPVTSAPESKPGLAPLPLPPGPPSQPPATNAFPPAAQPLPSTPPVNPETAAGTSDRVDLTATPAPETAPAPIYKRWWFWTAAAAVAVGAGIGIYAATSGGSPSAPSSTLGSKKVF